MFLKLSRVIGAVSARHTYSVIALESNPVHTQNHSLIEQTPALARQIPLPNTAIAPRPRVINPSWLTLGWRASHQFSARNTTQHNTTLSLRDAILPMILNLPENTSSTTVATYSPPKNKLFSREEIIQLLQNPALIKKLLANEDLQITPCPHTDTALTDLPQAFKITLFGYSTLATIATQAGGEQIVKLGTIEIPLQDIQHVLASPTTNMARLEAQPMSVGQLDRPHIKVAMIRDVLESPDVVETIETNDTLITASAPEELSEQPVPTSVSETPGAIDDVVDEPINSSNTETVLHQPDLEDTNEEVPPVISALNKTIYKIKDPLIKLRTMAVTDALLNLAKEEKTLKKVEQHINCTHQVLTAASGTSRQKANVEFKKLASEAKNSASPAWQAVGVAMMLLGALILGIGAACLTTGFIPSIACMPLGIAFIGTGASFFAPERSGHKNRHPDDLLTATM